MNIKKSSICLTVLLTAVAVCLDLRAGDSGKCGGHSRQPVSRHVISCEDERRAAELVGMMTLEEKIGYISGLKSFYIRAVPRLGIPEIRMADGPCGVRNNTRSTLYPCGICLAATWNREEAERLGHGLGMDARARGVDIMLGPGVNIYRAPMCGRNYEYFGEDPFLSGEIAKHYIIGLQEEGVMATVKHFAANNQEYARHSVSSDVDERTLNEIYFPAFRKAVQEAGVGAVMDSYNPVNGVHATENGWMNIGVLREQWGFRGIVMSDWTSTYSTAGIANGGLDLEMPKGVFFTEERLKAAIDSGIVREEDIDLKVQHILQTLISFGMLDNPRGADTSIDEDCAYSREAALGVAREGIVLLKNEGGNLPLKKGRVLVMGPNADRVVTGGGSGYVTPVRAVSAYQGLAAAKGEKNVALLSDGMLYEDISSEIFADADMTEKGFRGTYWPVLAFKGEPVMSRIDKNISFFWKYGSPAKGIPDDKFSVAWEGVYKAEKDGVVRFLMSGDDGYRLFVDGVLLGGDWGNHSLSSRSAFLDVKSGRKYQIRFEYFDNAGEATVSLQAGIMNEKLLEESLSGASHVVFCAGFDSNSEGEGFDRNFSLPAEQKRLIDRVASAHRNVTVVVNAGGGVDFSGWSENVSSVLMAWYPGQEGGTALAEILTGKVSPSGRLPVSIEKSWDDNPVHHSYYENAKQAKHVEYNEGIFVGYRGYDRSGISPEYPFGFGLSYTTFEYSDMSVVSLGDGKVKVELDVRNSGQMDASEVVQVYVSDCESSVKRPVKELKGYAKVFLRRGETRRVSIVLGPDAFAFYDVGLHGFRVEPGEFDIMAGGSSSDLPLSCRVYVGM
ncbi:MAG: glycoside hydrolase family 3 C-terminal domain-containing protein [Bacteroidales bacterium]|nr:glycoside hydrolase family 3 C-terminal domain-containing protein [Bacteroidales bacterium]